MTDDDEEGDDEPMTCPVCDRDIQKVGPCEHVVCAYEPLPGPTDAPHRVHFFVNRLPQSDLERLCGAIRDVALLTDPAERKKAIPGLPDMVNQLLYFVAEREEQDGDGTFAVPCDAVDDYLWVALHACATLAGGNSVEVFEGVPLASIRFRIYFATDVKACAAQVGERLREDAARVEGHRMHLHQRRGED